jgi:release factor glutamine methyltransferase
LEDKSSLAPEVVEYEPALALFAPGGDPDYWVQTLLEHARAWLDPRGRLLVELGLGQAPRVTALAREHGWETRLHRDLAGVERVLEGR